MGNNQGNSESIKKLSFWSLLKRYSTDQEVFSVKLFALSLIITCIFLYIIKNNNNVQVITKFVFNSILSASTDILAVIIASFGLFAAITDIAFTRTIYQLGQLENVLFPFWFCAILWVVNLFNSLLINLIIDSQLFSSQIIYMLTAGIFLFCISILYTLELIGDILRLTVYRAKLSFLDSPAPAATVFPKLQSINPNYEKFFWCYLLVFTIVLIGHLAWGCSLINPVLWLVYLFGAFDLALIYIGYKFYRKLIINDNNVLAVKVKFSIKILIIIILIYISWILSK
jgi:hypothetical protein